MVVPGSRPPFRAQAQFESTQTGRSRCLQVAATVAFLVAVGCCASGRAQSSNPADLRRIIDQKNAEAAAATWGYYRPPTGGPTQPSNPSAAPATGGGPGGTGPGSSASSGGGGAAGSFGAIAAAAPDPDVAPSATQPADTAYPNAPDAPSAASTPSIDVPQTSDSAAKPPAESDAGDDLDLPTRAAATPSHPAVVTFAAGLLKVEAANSSLSEILRQVCQATGMVLTGTVRDERVYGIIGPAKPSQVVAELLDGVKTNFVLRQNAEKKTLELLLTPRPAR